MKSKAARYHLLGHYSLGHEMISLITDRDTNSGGCNPHPDRKLCAGEVDGRGRILIGLNCEWRETVQLLLHEAFEYTAIRRGVRFQRTDKMANDYTDFLFAFDHVLLTEMMATISPLLVDALPDLADWHGRINRCEPERPNLSDP